MKTKYTILVSGGGLGDSLLLTPALRAIKRQSPASKIHIYCDTPKHLEIFRHNPFVDKLMGRSFWRRPLRTVAASRAWWKHDSVAYGTCFPSLTYDKHAFELIAEMLGVTLAQERPELFLTDHEELRAKRSLAPYQNCVVIHTTAEFTQNKNWLPGGWTELVRRCPQYTFVQIGRPTEDLVQGCMDLRSLPLRDAFAIVKNATAFVGVDSLFAHVASAFGTRAVVLFGPSNPAVWGNSNSTNLYAGVPCSPCIDILKWERCPYAKECMVKLSVEQVEAALNMAVSSIHSGRCADSYGAHFS